MLYKIRTLEDQELERFFEKAVLEISEFFGVDWKENKPNLYLVKDRKTIDALKDRKTPRWVVGWSGANGKSVFVLDKEHFTEESENTYSEERYEALIKHELVHCCFRIVTEDFRPRWLNEGLCTYLSGQLQWKEKPEKFIKFLESFKELKQMIYFESGWVVKILIEKFGKEKMLKLLAEIKETKLDEKNFKKMFEDLYKIKLSYTKFNRLLKQTEQ